jgi:hypothetical protein
LASQAEIELMKLSKRWSASLTVLLAAHCGQAHAEASLEKLARAKQAVRCSILNLINANSVKDQRVRDVVLGQVRTMSRHADELGATKDMKDKWFAEFELQLKDAYTEDNSAEKKVRDYSFLPREADICERLSKELLDALVKQVEEAAKAESKR